MRKNGGSEVVRFAFFAFFAFFACFGAALGREDYWCVRKGIRLDEGKGMGGVLLILERVALAEMHEAAHTLSMWGSVACQNVLVNIGKA